MGTMMHERLVGAKRAAGVVVAVVLFAGLWQSVPASAEAVPFWTISQMVAPTNVSPGGEGELLISVTDLGAAPADGLSTPLTFTDVLPPGLTATGVRARAIPGEGECTVEPLVCHFAHVLPSYEPLEIKIGVAAAENASGNLVNEATISGGGARTVVARDPVSVSAVPVKFGVENLEMQAFNEDGSFDTQAGSHPFELTTTISVNQGFSPYVFPFPLPHPVGAVKDLHFLLPAGLVGNPQVTPQCSETQFTTYLGPSKSATSCPNDTVVGVAAVSIPILGGWRAPVFNLTPSAGEPARFAFSIGQVPVYLDTSVRTGTDYGVTVSVSNISEIFGFSSSQLTFWGLPGAQSHNPSRGADCLMADQHGDGHTCGEEPVAQNETPFLTLPTSCEGPFKTSVLANSWEEPANTLEGLYTLHDNTSPAIGLDGCNRLPFEPSISVVPDGQASSTPTGLTVGIHVPQEAALTPAGLSEADVRNTTVTLPEGVALNPAAADGLLACSIGQIGFENIDPTSNTALFSPAGASCPEDSKVGTVQIKTPLLPDSLEGGVYLAAQNANPFGSLVALYIVAEDPIAGVLVKLAGRVAPDPVTGQLVSTFQNTPQLPFEDLHLKFFGTARAPLNTPALCGAYTTKASIASWSGNPPSESSSSFQIISGPNGTPCSNPLPFAPSLTAGSPNIQAGAFSPFTLTMSREDGDQPLSEIQLHMPPGLLGMLSSVKLCKEPEAGLGTCGPESLIGHTIVSVGLGGDPFSVTGGRVFITEGYKGAPYGLSIVNPAKAGPFDLGQVVVRAKIEVDPHTAALTVTSDPLPTILDGIPLQIRHVNVTIDRQGFTFNPTDCQPLRLGGTLSSTEGATQTLGVPFQVTNCATLVFKPQFAVSTFAHFTRADGTSLDVKLNYPRAPFGSQANIARVKVELPKRLPSRLTTLQHACPDSVFNANPASCPAASLVGHASASTPVLANTLSGPAYFVSHGGAAFPDLIVVLQGEGVTVDLVGSTFISKSGVTSSTFQSVPDVPIGSFGLTLPAGAHSALTGNGNLCKGKLVMPTEFLAQNGAAIHQSTKIAVAGCSKTKQAKSRHRHAKKAGGGRSGKGARRGKVGRG